METVKEEGLMSKYLQMDDDHEDEVAAESPIQKLDDNMFMAIRSRLTLPSDTVKEEMDNVHEETKRKHDNLPQDDEEEEEEEEDHEETKRKQDKVLLDDHEDKVAAESPIQKLDDNLLDMAIRSRLTWTSHTRFGRVCKSWRRITEERPYQYIPWLMLNSKLVHNKQGKSVCTLYSLDEQKLHKMNMSNTASRSRCCGSSDQGWLLMSHKTRGNFLYNPITRDRLNLPRHKLAWYGGPVTNPNSLGKPHYYMIKAALSTSISTTCPNDVLVSVIFAEDFFIGFAMPGAKDWVVICYEPYPYTEEEEDDDDDDEEEEEEEEEEEDGDNDEDAEEQGADDNDEDVGNGNEDGDQVEQGAGGQGVVDDYNSDDYEEDEAEAQDANDGADDEVEIGLGLKTFSAVTFFKGHFYTITKRAEKLGIMHISIADNKQIEVTPIWHDMLPLKLKKKDIFHGGHLNNEYLVESRGELLMVIRTCREVRPGIITTKKFFIYKLDETSEPFKWVRVESLGDQTLFLSDKYCKSISNSDLPCSMRNRIYFLDESWNDNFSSRYSKTICHRDMGVFNLEDQKFEKIFPLDCHRSYLRDYCTCRKYPPIFFMPKPNNSCVVNGKRSKDKT